MRRACSSEVNKDIKQYNNTMSCSYLPCVGPLGGSRRREKAKWKEGNREKQNNLLLHW